MKYRKSTTLRRNKSNSNFDYSGLEPRCLLAANLILSEFMASNVTTLEDAYGNTPDWIEIQNNGDAAVDLIGYHLTDNATNPTKWTFPSSRVLSPGQYLIVFASSRNLVDPAGNLHTNFSLSDAGEYLGLFSPTEILLSQFGTSSQNYPPQISDISYGVTSSALLSAGSPATYLIPTDGNLGTTWTQNNFNATANGFSTGFAAIGYENSPGSANNFTNEIRTSVPVGTTSLYLRTQFTIANLAVINQLSLGVKYDDGFGVYLNGTLLSQFSRNTGNGMAWNALASDQHPDAEALQYEMFDLTPHIGLLQNGVNTLTFHALNTGSGSSDFLLSPLLTSNSLTGPSTYLATATPGTVNSNLINLGPRIDSLNVNGGSVTAGQPFVVTARVTAFQNPVSTNSISLKYRVMFGNEVTLAMNDSGTGGDAIAGDQIYSATITGSALVAGQMVRWYVTGSDTNNYSTRAPRFLRALDSAQYFGAFVTNPAVNTDLPLMQWFLENPAAADSGGGTRASLFMSGEFYDNIQVDIHGQSTQGFPKKSYDFDANSGEKFWVSNKIGRASDLNLLTNYADQAKIRHPMAYDVYEQADHPALTGHHVTLYRNGSFYGLYDVIEEGDEEFLERVGLDSFGALYKVNNPMTSSTSGVEKRSRNWENNSDLQQVVTANSFTGTAAAIWDFDNFDVAALINNLAIHTVIGNSDFGHKNMYWYHDNDGTGLWWALPWDQDLSFGHYWNGQYFDNTLFTNTPLTHAGNNPGNNIFARVYTNPTTAAMYWRRLRTLTDQMYGVATTNLQDTYIYQQSQLRRLATQDEAVTDLALWGLQGNFAAAYPFNPSQAVDQIQNAYISGRRTYITNDSRTPSSQVGLPTILFDPVNYDANPVSNLQTEEYVRLNNPNNFAVDITGWKVRGDISYTFKGGTVIPANGSLYLVRDIKAFKARSVGPRGGQQLFIQGNYSGELSNLGATVTLRAPNDTLLDTLSIPAGNLTANQQFLRISEINYNPYTSVANAEFIELVNTGPAALNLSGVRITEGPSTPFVFASGTTLNPGQRTLVVQDISNFLARYPSVSASQIAGIYTGNLNNAGENIRLEEPGGELILEFNYGDNDPWFVGTDGSGLTLELVNETNTSLLKMGKYYSWRPSAAFNGTPGQPSVTTPPGVVINEILSHTDAPQRDSIELFNPTSQAVLIGGLFLSDSATNLLKYQIPAGTVIPAGGYLVFDESHFNPTPANPLPHHFSINGAEGDDLWLTAAVSNVPTTVWFHVTFGATFNGQTLARFPNGSGRFLPSLKPTLGTENSDPKVGPLVISEFNYNPALPSVAALAIAPTMTRQQLEFVEIKNPTLQTINLTNWRLRGQLDFDFAAGTTLLPGETIVVITFDPLLPANANLLSAFRTHYGIGTSVRLVGTTLTTNLNDSFGRISLQRPDVPPPTNPTLIPRVLVDEVVYDDLPPWETGADGIGPSMNRIVAGMAGTLAPSWATLAPTPGAANMIASLWTRGLFYNQSSFDGNSSAANASDDGAFATNKSPLFNGQTATFANYSSYQLGINGLMIDVFGLSAAPTASNFQFRVGNVDDTANWTSAPAPASIAVRPGAGAGEADRVSIVWANGAIVNKWLQVTLTVNGVTDVFYFGNAIGETGNDPANAIVNLLDVAGARTNQTGFGNAGILNRYDFNRDNRVNLVDVAIARSNQSGFTPVRLITPGNGSRPGTGSGGGRSSSLANQVLANDDSAGKLPTRSNLVQLPGATDHIDLSQPLVATSSNDATANDATSKQANLIATYFADQYTGPQMNIESKLGSALPKTQPINSTEGRTGEGKNGPSIRSVAATISGEPVAYNRIQKSLAALNPNKRAEASKTELVDSSLNRKAEAKVLDLLFASWD